MNRKTFLKLSSLYLASLSCSTSSGIKQERQLISKKVLIIGAGMSGVAAAERLNSSGYEVEIFEARDRVGGRIHTNRELGVPIDLGAGWIHGNKKNPLTSLSKKYGVRTRETDFDNALILEKNKEVSSALLEKSYSKFQEILEKLKESVDSPSSDKSMRELLDIFYSKESLDSKDKKFFPLFERGLENENGLELAKISAYGFFQMGDKIEGADELVYDGYDKIVNGILGGISVRLNEQVLLVRSSNNRVEIETNRGKYFGDFVIVTVPVSVLQKNSIRFEPSLPREKTEAINRIPFGFYSKLILEFPEKFWSSEEVFTQLDGLPKQWYEILFNLENYTGKPILGFLSSGDRAKYVEKEKDILSQAKTELVSIFGSKIPSPSRFLKTNWSGDPHALGAYTAPHRDMESLIELYSKPFGKIYFAGEGTHEKYFSYVHGAYLSGLREANRLLDI